MEKINIEEHDNVAILRLNNQVSNAISTTLVENLSAVINQIGYKKLLFCDGSIEEMALWIKQNPNAGSCGDNSQARIEGWGQERLGCRDGDRGLDLARRAENIENLRRATPRTHLFFDSSIGLLVLTFYCPVNIEDFSPI